MPLLKWIYDNETLEVLVYWGIAGILHTFTFFLLTDTRCQVVESLQSLR